VAKGALKRRRVNRNVPNGVAHIQATFNNTIVTFTNLSGEVLCWSTSGAKGFKGSRKSTSFAAQVAAEDCAKKAMDMGMKTVAVLVKGPGSGRESAVRGIGNSGLKVSLIRDVTPIPHNGCKPPKRRRV